MTVTTPPPPIRAAVARRTDPETSHAAAASLDPDTLRVSQAAVLSIIRQGRTTDERLVRNYTTSSLHGNVPPQSPSGIRTRRKELVERGFVRDSGGRARLASGRAAVVWEAVP